MNNKQKITSLLSKHNIPFWLHGNNVSIGSINVQCPYCGDHSNHMGIFYADLMCSCWRCTRSAPFFVLFSRLTGLSLDESEKTVEEKEVDFSETTTDQIKQIFDNTVEFSTDEEVEVVLPEGCIKIEKDDYFGHFKAYLDRRHISIQTVIEYDCYICKMGDFCNRMIIPVYFGGKLVSYQGADITGRDKVKYKTAIGCINNYLYNYDSVEDTMFITEGILDSWRVGDCAVASFGTHLTDRQKTLILKKKLTTLMFLWDGDAHWKAKKEAEFFRPFIENISIIKLPTGEDPDSLGTEKVWEYILRGVFDGFE